MKKLIFLLLMGLIPLWCWSQNSQSTGATYEYATVDTVPVAGGYWTNTVNMKQKGVDLALFSVRGTGKMIVTVQYQFPGETTWRTYRLVSSLGSFHDTIVVPGGTDTTYYYPFYTRMPWGLNVNYKDFDDTDAILDLGTTPSPDSTIFDRLNSVELPFTLADSSVSFEKPAFNFGWLAIKLTAGSVTEGQSIFMDVWRDDSETWFVLESHGVGVKWRAGVEAGNYQVGECSFGFDWLKW